MNYAKKYVEYLLERQAQSIQAAPSAPAKYNLPGLRTFAQLEKERRKALRRELDSAQASLVAVNKKIKSTKTQKVKADLKEQRDNQRRWIAELQFRLGREKGAGDAE